MSGECLRSVPRRLGGSEMTAESPFPHGLDARGGAFWTHATDTYELSESETQLLREVCRLLDEVESLRGVLDTDGMTVAGASGQTRVHPAVTEIRQHRLTLGRLLAQLALPDPEGESLPTPAQSRAKRAAAARWAGHQKRSS